MSAYRSPWRVVMIGRGGEGDILTRIAAMHTVTSSGNHCSHCLRAWPCPTYRLATGADVVAAR